MKSWKAVSNELARLRSLHGADRSLVRRFPDLSVEQRTSPCSNSFSGSTARRPDLPPDAKQFPIGHSHKQGLMLITPETDPQWMGGKKT